MNEYLDRAAKMLADNERVGMSSSLEPIQWNLHNAIFALLKGVEEENEKLRARVAELERIVRSK